MAIATAGTEIGESFVRRFVFLRFMGIDCQLNSYQLLHSYSEYYSIIGGIHTRLHAPGVLSRLVVRIFLWREVGGIELPSHSARHPGTVISN